MFSKLQSNILTRNLGLRLHIPSLHAHESGLYYSLSGRGSLHGHCSSKWRRHTPGDGTAGGHSGCAAEGQCRLQITSYMHVWCNTLGDVCFAPAYRKGETEGYWLRHGVLMVAICRKLLVVTGSAISCLICTNRLRKTSSHLVGAPFLTLKAVVVFFVWAGIH